METKTRYRLAEERAADLGLSIEDMCKRAGIDRSTWTRWKNGRDPMLSKWEAVQAALDNKESAS